MGISTHSRPSMPSDRRAEPRPLEGPVALEVRELQRLRAHAIVATIGVAAVAARVRIAAVVLAERWPKTAPDDLHAVTGAVEVLEFEPLPAGGIGVVIAAAF